MSLKFKRAGIVVKPHEDVVGYLREMIATIESLGADVVLEEIAAKMIGTTSSIPRSEIAEHSDIVLLIGGDGTFLSVARDAVKANVPIAGFNLGTLGFLTELNKDAIRETLPDIFSGSLDISHRKLLEIEYKNQIYTALNDVVVSKGNIARIVTLMLEIDDIPVTRFGADGVIIATPTGSTAYSLSAGGPIVAPDVNGMIITPICPHSLTFRPLVIRDQSTVRVRLMSKMKEVFITIDGQVVVPMAPGDTFKTRIHSDSLKIIQSKNMNYYKLLYEKLNWGL